MAEKKEDNSETWNNSLNSKSDGETGPSSSENEKEVKRNINTANAVPMFMIAASPPKFISFEQLMSAANGVKNMSLAHEIAVNHDFQLQKLQPQENSIIKKVRDVMHKAFWDALEAKLNESPPDFSQAVVLIEEVKEALISLLLPQHVRLRVQIEEVLDKELICQQMEHDAFDLHFYANYVISTMARLCAPVRDERVARLKDIPQIVPLFKDIFEVLELMKMDMANFTIQQIRPYLQQQSVEYERLKFNEFLKTQQENGTDALVFTRLWLTKHFEQLLTLEKSGESPSCSSDSAKVTPASILNEAYMETLNWDESNPYPETLLLDQSRFCDLQKKCQLLTMIASVQLVTYSTVGAAIADIQSLKQTLKSHVQTLLEGEDGDVKNVLVNIAEQVKKDVNDCLVQHGFTPLTQDQSRILHGQITDLPSTSNPVSTLIKQRMTSFIKQSISSCVEPLKVPAGFSAVEKELTEVLGQFMRLTSHNRSVFGPHYSDIIASLLQRQQDISPR